MKISLFLKAIFVAGVMLFALLAGSNTEKTQVSQVSPVVPETVEVAEIADPLESSSFKTYLDAYRWIEKHSLSDKSVSVDTLRDAFTVLFEGSHLEKALMLADEINENPKKKSALYGFLIRSPSNSSVLFDYLSENIEYILDKADRNQTNRGAIYAWGGSYLLDSTLRGYEITGDERFLILARDAILEMLDYRDDKLKRKDVLRGRILKAWGTDHLDPSGSHYNVVTHSGRIASMMARYAWLVEQDQSLSTEHHEAAKLFKVAAETALLEFEDQYIQPAGTNYGYYRGVANWSAEPLNHLTSIALATLYLSELSDTDPIWSARTSELAEFTKQAIYTSGNGTFVWRYNPLPENPYTSNPEQIWKGQVTIRFLVLAERLDKHFNEDYLSAVGKSFRINVLRDGTYFNAQISEYYDPLWNYQFHERGGLINLTPYAQLADYDSQLMAELEDALASTPEIGGWLSSWLGSISYVERLAL